MARIGFIVEFDEQAWMGGVYYLLNLFEAVADHGENHLHPVVITGEKTLVPTLEKRVQIFRTSLLDKWSSAWVLRKGAQRLLSSDHGLAKWLKRKQITTLSHSVPIHGHPEIRCAGWIPDFQHHHLPDFFSRDEVLQRDRLFRRVISESHVVFVSSEHARKDLARFAPEHSDKASVLRFAVKPHPELPHDEIQSVLARYSIERDFIYLPNQFWAHKNHVTVIEALKVLAARRERTPLVIATGSMKDHRNPSHFASIRDLVEKYGVHNEFRILGVVPRDDMLALMQSAIAVLNPSLFEGWSTTVEEAKSIGKPLVLSDIPVHREQGPAGTIFFNPLDAEAAAAAIQQCVEKYDGVGMDSPLAAQERYAAFARRYISSVESLTRTLD